MGETKLVSVGSLKKGSYVVVEGIASIVSDTATSRPGKHGHAKVNFMAVGILDGKKRNAVMPGHDMVDVPVIGKRTAQILSISGKHANVMDGETFETFDLEIPEELQGQVVEGTNVVYWTILDDKVMKSIKVD
jgi:translation initiation factor 5A